MLAVQVFCSLLVHGNALAAAQRAAHSNRDKGIDFDLSNSEYPCAREEVRIAAHHEGDGPPRLGIDILCSSQMCVR